MRVGELFAGIGGFGLGLERAGHEVAWQIEIDPFCQRVLAHHWPSVPRYEDIRSVALASEAGEQQLERVDLLCGGFPCQDLSVAGKRAGLAGERSGLFWEFLRVARSLHPRWVLLENVPGLLSSHRGRDFGAILEGLEDSGYWWAYRILDSQHFGVAQRRRRVFIVGHRGGPCSPSVLFEPTRRTRHPAPGREAGARVAASLTSGAHGAGVSAPGRRKEDDVNLVATGLTRRYGKGTDSDATDTLVAATLNPGHEAKHSYPGDGGTFNLVVGALNSNKERGGWRCGPDEAMAGQLIAHTLKAEGHDASEDGTGRRVPMVISGRNRGDDGRGYEREPHISALAALDTVKVDRVVFGSSVRRLTPTECERLQGFPDGWTCLCGAEPYSTMTCRCPDSPRHRSLGNAVTVNVIEWIGRHLMEANT